MEDKSALGSHENRECWIKPRREEESNSSNDLASSWLSDAARCGEILARNPGDRMARQYAARLSKNVSSALGTRFTCEDDLLLHWVGERNLESERAGGAQLQRQPELRRLAIEVTSVSFESDSDARIKRAGSALRDFVNILDKTISWNQFKLKSSVVVGR